ncbi:MAG TPA: class I SAM-dependent methyltransferase [Kofleriaceae bacterium]|jgi:cyclopropane fatty-acyl-phospholipid synthase-like methyltransferase|nr:class I SAM-dependent methyltransferase [Kofleriaceae bacterium]
MPKLLWLVAASACGGPARVEPAPPTPAAEHRSAMHHGAMHADSMPHRFENADEWAKDFDNPARDAWQRPDLVLAALELGPGMTIADIGAGTGYFSVRLARAVPDGKIIATDIEPDMIRYMTERAAREHLPNLRAVQTPPDDPQLAPGTVDRILVVDVWHHLGDRAAYARALARALRPGGKLAVVDFTLTSSHGPPPEHRLSPDQVLADLRSAGLTAALSTTTLPEQYIAIGTR